MGASCTRGNRNNSAYGIPIGGGTAKQGLITTTNRAINGAMVDHIRSRAHGNRRDWVFCVNQLGGVGNRYNRQFSASADGLGRLGCYPHSNVCQKEYPCCHPYVHCGHSHNTHAEGEGAVVGGGAVGAYEHHAHDGFFVEFPELSQHRELGGGVNYANGMEVVRKLGWLPRQRFCRPHRLRQTRGQSTIHNANYHQRGRSESLYHGLVLRRLHRAHGGLDLVDACEV